MEIQLRNWLESIQGRVSCPRDLRKSEICKSPSCTLCLHAAFHHPVLHRQPAALFKHKQTAMLELSVTALLTQASTIPVLQRAASAHSPGAQITHTSRLSLYYIHSNFLSFTLQCDLQDSKHAVFRIQTLCTSLGYF